MFVFDFFKTSDFNGFKDFCISPTLNFNVCDTGKDTSATWARMIDYLARVLFTEDTCRYMTECIPEQIASVTHCVNSFYKAVCRFCMFHFILAVFFMM